MKRAILGTVLALLLAVVAFVAYSITQSLHYYDIEGSIHAAFYPLIPALDRYSEEHQKAPDELDDLVPDYLDEIPALGRVSDVRYTHEQGKPHWRLTLESLATGDKRLYIAESGMPLSEDEKRDLVLQYHSRWNVLEPKQAEQGVGGQPATAPRVGD